MSVLKCSGVFLFSILCLLTTQGSQTVVTLTSGERLIGEISSVPNAETLIINSAVLGELKLPKSQILRQEPFSAPDMSENSVVPAALVPEDQAKTALVLTEEEMSLVEEDSVVEKLINLQTPESWSGNLRFGLDLNSGDSQWRQLYSKGNLVIDPPQAPNYYRFTGSYTYRTTERNGQSFKSTDRYDGNFTYRRDTLGPFFLQNSIGGRVDEVRGINHEIQELVGLGIRIEPSERIKFVVGGGGGIEDYDPEFDDTRAGVHPVANVFQELTWRPFEKATLAQEFNYFLNPNVTEQYNYVFSASFRYRLTDLLGFEVSFDQNFDNDVGNGNIRDDARWRNAIIVYF